MMINEKEVAMLWYIEGGAQIENVQAQLRKALGYFEAKFATKPQKIGVSKRLMGVLRNGQGPDVTVVLDSIPVFEFSFTFGNNVYIW